jgi:hypothetical protein
MMAGTAVLVEGIEDLADQIALGVFAQLLRDGHKLHAGAPQFPDVKTPNASCRG